MVQQQGIGRVRHLDASLLWVQQKKKENTLSIGRIPAELNCADLGAKALTKKRMMGFLYMLKMVQHGGDRVGKEEYREIEQRADEERIEEGDEEHKSSHWIAADDGRNGPGRRQQDQ